MDLYDALGVARDATDDQIRAAKRRLASELHPDRNNEPDAHERMAAVNRAYDVLSDPERRLAYDAGEREGMPSIADEAAAILESLFSEGLSSTSEGMLTFLRHRVADMLEKAQALERTSVAERERLLRRRPKVRTKVDKPNLLHAIIDRRVRELEERVQFARRGMQIHGVLVKLVDEYESDEEAPTRRDELDEIHSMMADMGFASSAFYGRPGRRNAA